MTEIYNELNWIITTYGKNRLTEMLANPEQKIKITKLMYGSGGSGTPQSRETEDGTGRLLDPKGTSVVYEKGLDADRPNTVYFKSVIGENVSGYDIRELALIETLDDGTDKMFAIGVGAPIVKPSLSLGYIITVDYALYLESINLYKVYDQIELDPDNKFLKKDDIEDLHKIFLFAEGNLCEQISNNTHILGLNRAEQLNQMITESQKTLADNSIVNYYVSLLNSLNASNSEIIGFWPFNYTDTMSNVDDIKDFSDLGNNLSTRVSLNLYPQEYISLLSTLNFKDTEYFYLNKVHNATTNNPTNIELGELIDHNTVDKYVWYNNSWRSSTTEATKTEAYFKANICKYYLKASYATTTSTKITIVTVEDVPDIKSKGFVHTWTYNNSFWTNEIGTKYDVEEFKALVVNYTGSPDNNDTIVLSTPDTPSEDDAITLTGKQFDLLNKTQNNDCPFALVACLQHNKLNENNTILAQSTYFGDKHNFEVIKTDKNGILIKLFSSKDKYIEIKTENNVITDSVYTLIINYNGNKSNPVIAVYINGNRQNIVIENKGYTGMTNNILKTTSYIEDEKGNVTNTINAKVGLISLIKNYNGTAALTEEQVKSTSLVLNSLCGKNVYYKV